MSMSTHSIGSPGFYSELVKRHGAVSQGVGWASRETHKLRMEALTRGLPILPCNSILDVGCGYGALITHLRRAYPAWCGTYMGVDFCDEMVELFTDLNDGDENIFAKRLDILEEEVPLTYDRVFISGTFSFFDIEQMNTALNNISFGKSLSFNFLTDINPGYLEDNVHSIEDVYALVNDVYPSTIYRHIINGTYKSGDCTIQVILEGLDF